MKLDSPASKESTVKITLPDNDYGVLNYDGLLERRGYYYVIRMQRGDYKVSITAETGLDESRVFSKVLLVPEDPEPVRKPVRLPATDPARFYNYNGSPDLKYSIKIIRIQGGRRAEIELPLKIAAKDIGEKRIIESNIKPNRFMFNFFLMATYRYWKVD